MLVALVALSGSISSRCDAAMFGDQGVSYFGTDVVEGASKHAESPTEAPATITVITRDDIERYGFLTIADVINFASVGYFVHNDRHEDFVGGRGLFFFEDYNTRLLVLLNGHPLNEPWNGFGAVGRAMLPPIDIVDRVEFVYGPSALLYGGYSLYGMINVVTRKGATLPGRRLRLSGGNFGTGEAVFSWGASGIRGEDETSHEWDVLVAANAYDSSGEDLNLPPVEVDYPVDLEGGSTWGGPQRGTDFERAPGLFLRAAWDELTFTARTGYRRKGVPLAWYESIYGGEGFVRDEKSFAEIRWDHALRPGSEISVRLFNDWYAYEEVDPYADPVTIGSGHRFNLVADDTDAGGELRVTSRFATHSVIAGVEYRSRGIDQEIFYKTLEGDRIEGSTKKDSFDGSMTVVYAQDEWRPRDEWAFVLGGTFADTEPGGTKMLPRAAVIVRPRPEIALKALYAEGFRPPSIYETDYGDFEGQIPNPALESEAVSSSELSMIWTPGKRLQLTAYAFHSQLRDLVRDVLIESVDQVQGGISPPSGEMDDLIGQLQYQSAGDVESKGAGVSLQLGGIGTKGYLNLAWAESTLEEHRGTSQELPANPSWVASGGISRTAGDWTASLAARALGPQRLDPSRESDEMTDPLVVVNFQLVWKTRIVYPVDLFLNVRNLFDDDGLVPANPIYAPDTFPSEGRRVTVGATLQF